VDGRSWLWWVVNNVVWTNSWLSIAGAGCGLICVGVGEEWARKVYALQGLRGVKMQVGLTRGTRWPVGSSVGRMVARKGSRSHRSEPVQGSSSQPKSTRGVWRGSPQNRPGYLVEPQNQDRRLAGGEGSGRTEKLQSGGHASGSQGLHRGYAKGGRQAPVRWCYKDIFPKCPWWACILPIFPMISIGLDWELHGEILSEGWMLRRQARPCMNLSWRV
jgi:hypothetical protein